ncbi:MAG: biotin--[acetyl-CoA-carboxylase] ligase [Thermoplasmatota archaeon]
MNQKRNDIIQMLKPGKIISGQEIARTIGISRTAVWKHIKLLQKNGYIIESTRQKGYRLQGLPEIPIEEIESHLHTSCIGSRLMFFPSLTSTNEYVNKMVKQQYPEGTVVIAETQTFGRGRKQRTWCSPKGGLWFSLLLHPKLPPQKAMIVTMATSIALAEAIKETTGLEVRIKWPNDLLINGKKVCGILTELSAEMDQIDYMIIGIGMNVNNKLPDSLLHTAISLEQLTSQPISLMNLLIASLSLLDEWYMQVRKNNERLIRDTWLSLSDMIGKQIEVKQETSLMKGVVIGITENGGLLIETQEGTKQIVSGDISYI